MIKHKIEILKEALMTQSNRLVKKALMKVVPTYEIIMLHNGRIEAINEKNGTVFKIVLPIK